MVQIYPRVRELLQQLRESSFAPVTWREYQLLVAMIALAVLIGIVALFK